MLKRRSNLDPGPSGDDCSSAKKQNAASEDTQDRTLPADEADFLGLGPLGPYSQSVYARLQQLDRRVDTIELYSPLFIAGRLPEGKETQTYLFDRLKLKDSALYQLISRQHFTIEHDCGFTFIVDHSSNGTFVNNEPIAKGTRTALKHADVISIGLPDIYFWLYDERQVVDWPAAVTDKYLVSNVELGKGGYSQVLLAKVRSRAWRRVAIKVLRKTADTQFSRLLADEAEIEREMHVMGQIKHPNCLRFVDFLQDSDRAFLVLEYLGGGDLFTRITENKDAEGMCTGVGEKVGKFFCYQILQALQYLHNAGITHRDIKPENVLLADRAEYTLVKLCDFGLAKPHDDASTMKSYVGTPAYIAPEIIGNEGAYTVAVDVWSTGVVLFLMVSGYPPFCESYGDMDLDEQTKTGRLIFTPQWKRVSADAQTIVRRMLRTDPRQRITVKDALATVWFDPHTVVRAQKVITDYQKQNDWLD